MVIKVLIFDLGRVIVNLNFNQFVNKVIIKSPRYKAESNSLLLDFWNETLIYDKGLVSKEEYFHHACKFLNIDNISHSDFFNAFTSVISDTNEEIIQIIKSLKKKGDYKFFILSNVNPTHWNYGLGKKWDFIDLFDDFLLSFELHMIKPDERIYKHIIKRTRCQPEEIVLIDDTLENITTARLFGIHGIHYNDIKSLIEELRELKIIL